MLTYFFLIFLNMYLRICSYKILPSWLVHQYYERLNRLWKLALFSYKEKFSLNFDLHKIILWLLSYVKCRIFISKEIILCYTCLFIKQKINLLSNEWNETDFQRIWALLILFLYRILWNIDIIYPLSPLINLK